MNDPNTEIIDSCPVCEGTQLIEESRRLKLWRCASCRVLFNSPRPSPEFIQRNYSEGHYYERFTPDARWEGLWERRMTRLLRHRLEGPVLDVSAGVGTAVNNLRKKGYDCRGSEISKEAIARARQLYGIDLTPAYPEDLAFERESLGCVMMWHVFEHFPYPGRALRSLSEKLRPNGLLAVAVPNNSLARLAKRPSMWLASREAKFEYIVGSGDYGGQFQEIHLIHFTPRSLLDILRHAGFAVVEYGIDNTLSEWRDRKIPVRNFFARWLGFNDAPAMVIIARKLPRHAN